MGLSHAEAKIRVAALSEERIIEALKQNNLLLPITATQRTLVIRRIRSRLMAILRYKSNHATEIDATMLRYVMETQNVPVHRGAKSRRRR